MRVKRIFVFDRTNHNRNESRRDFRRATRPIHRHRADEWKKHPQWVLLVHSSGILAFRLVAFAPFQGARLSAPEPAALPPPPFYPLYYECEIFLYGPTSRREHIRRVGKSTRNGCFWYTRRESNPNLRLRRPPFYPLYYECMHTQALPRACRFIITDFCKKDKENHSPE